MYLCRTAGECLWNQKYVSVQTFSVNLPRLPDFSPIN